MNGCHRCAWRDDPDRLERCLKCTAADADGGGLKVGHGSTVSIDAAEDAELVLRRARAWDCGASPTVTGLPDEVEDRLRTLLAAAVGLADWDALLMLHLLRGESLADAARNIEMRMPGAQGAYDRRQAHRRFNAACAAFPPFAEILRDRAAWMRPGKAERPLPATRPNRTRRRDAVPAGMTQPDLFGFGA